MRRLLTSAITAALIGVSATAGSITLADDSELAGVSAQGFTINFQTIDSVITSSTQVQPGYVRIDTSNVSMVDSVMVSGNAQQNAFVPINAVNSAVNVPINIVIVMKSHIGGNINISNVLHSSLR